MSLKDAIREAAGERDKQDNTKPLQDQEPQEEPQAVLQESSKDAKEPHRKTINTANSKAVFTSNNKSRKLANERTPLVQNKAKAATISPQPESVPELQEIELAALTVRVPRNSRIHWLVSAKKQNTTLTAAIIEALNERFGVVEE